MKKISFLLFVIIAISKSINSFPSADISPEANTSSPGDSLIDSLNSDYNAKQIESVLNSSDKTADTLLNLNKKIQKTLSDIRTSQLETKPKNLHKDFNEISKRNDDSKDDDDDDDEDDDEDESKSKKKSGKDGKSKKKHKKLKKKAKKVRVLLVNDKDDDDIDEPKEKSDDKLSSKQLKQIYQFIKEKKVDKPEKDSIDSNLLLSSLLLSSSNGAVHSELRDSLAAKAANKLLLKWHEHAPFASIHELEEMYNKFYEYYYDLHYGHHHHHHYHHGHPDFFDHHHFHHDHDHHLHHHHHDHFNLLDFLQSKSENDQDSDKSLADKLMSSHLFSALNLNGLHEHHYDDDHHDHLHHYHHHHEWDPDYYHKYHDHDNFHHHHHHHHRHHHYPYYYPHHDHLHHLQHHYDHVDHFDYLENYRYLKRNFLILKNKINYYQAQNMLVPWSLLQDYNRLSHILEIYHEHPPHHFHHYHHHHHHDYPHYYTGLVPRLYGRDFHYLFPLDDELHYDDDYHLHHMLHHYTNDMVNVLNKQMYLPPLQTRPSPPVVCMNYPDHTGEGFKSFISVESCSQPSYMSSSGVPVFGEGCTFHYICELGYQPLGGSSSSIIRCSNGFWTARAVCLKQEVLNNNKNQPKTLNAQNNPTQSGANSFQNKIDNLSQQHLINQAGMEQQARLIKKRSLPYDISNEITKKEDDSDYNVDKSLSEPIEILSESIEKQLQNEIFWNNNNNDSSNNEYIEQIVTNSSVENTTKSEPFINVSTTHESNPSTTTIVPVTSVVTDESTTSNMLTTTTSLFSTSSIQSSTTNIISTTTGVPKTSRIISTMSVESTKKNQKKHDMEKNSLRKIMSKKLKNNQKEDESNPSANISSGDWSSIMNNDSEKTIYETFYELLDNGYDYSNRIHKTNNKQTNNMKINLN